MIDVGLGDVGVALEAAVLLVHHEAAHVGPALNGLLSALQNQVSVMGLTFLIIRVLLW